VVDLEKTVKCPAKMNNCRIYDAYVRLKLECARLKKLSIKDELTGYYNYAFLMNTLNNEIERTKRSGLSTSIIMADIDFFKRINDKFGHEMGNVVLRRASRIWKENIRKMDFPCRYGGEEFVFILPGENLANAVKMAERLRSKLAIAPLLLKNESVTLTASFGVEQYNGHGNDTAASIIERVDRLMYQAKQSGRNCTCYDKSRVVPPAQQISIQERKALYNQLF
jgi:diguanylate cyclase (GGDEF)-like protein